MAILRGCYLYGAAIVNCILVENGQKSKAPPFKVQSLIQTEFLLCLRRVKVLFDDMENPDLAKSNLVMRVHRMVFLRVLSP